MKLRPLKLKHIKISVIIEKSESVKKIWNTFRFPFVIVPQSRTIYVISKAMLKSREEKLPDWLIQKSQI